MRREENNETKEVKIIFPFFVTLNSQSSILTTWKPYEIVRWLQHKLNPFIIKCLDFITVKAQTIRNSS